MGSVLPSQLGNVLITTIYLMGIRLDCHSFNLWDKWRGKLTFKMFKKELDRLRSAYIYIYILDYPPASEASREVANLTERKNPHTERLFLGAF